MDEGPDDCVQLSARLVALHAALLGCERQAYEARHGRTETRQLFRQVIHHEQSAWLRSLSAMIARIDGSPRRGQLLHSLKNVSMIGGLLLLSSLGSERQPGVQPRAGWSG
jgi:hypothetical protein